MKLVSYIFITSHILHIKFFLKIQPYFSSFWKISKFHFLNKKLYFEGFRLGFRNWKVMPNIFGNLQLLIQSFVFLKSNLKPRKEVIIFSDFWKMMVLLTQILSWLTYINQDKMLITKISSISRETRQKILMCNILKCIKDQLKTKILINCILLLVKLISCLFIQWN